MRKAVATALAILSVAILRAQDAGSSAMPFSLVPRDARTLSLGLVSDISDPAYRLLDGQKLNASLSWYSWAPSGTSSTDINADAFVRLGQKFGVAFQFGFDSGSAYDIYDADGIKGDSFNPSELFVKLGASYRILPMLSASLSARYMSNTIAPEQSYSAFAGDALVAASFGSARAAAGVCNIGTPVTASDGTSYGLPAAVSVAGGYKFLFADAHSLDASAQADVFFRGGFRAGVGAEYGFKDLAFFRLGYSYGGKSPMPSCFTIGIGARYYGFTIDAVCLLGTPAISGTLGVAMGYRF